MSEARGRQTVTAIDLEVQLYHATIIICGACV